MSRRRLTPPVTPDSPWTRLYLARWPDGTAMIVSAQSMADVAGRLDEEGDPGTCEVTPLCGELALVVRPSREVRGGFGLDVSLDALDDGLDVQDEILAAGFPLLHALLAKVRSQEPTADQLDPNEWSLAVAGEQARELAPSREWADAVAEWWEEMSGAGADESAAARQLMRVTIPGEPSPSPQAREHFEAEHRRIRARIDKALASDGDASGPPKTKPPTGTKRRRSAGKKTR